jgi:hypothetical protein
MFFLLEGRTGETWEPSKKQSTFGSRGVFGRKVLSLLPSFFFSHTSSTYPLLGLFCLLIHMDTYTLSRTFRDEGSNRPRDLYLTKHNTHKKQTSIPQAGFESTIPARERPQNYAADRKATGIFFPCWKQLIYCGIVSTHESRTFLQYQCFIVRISIDPSLYSTLHD